MQQPRAVATPFVQFEPARQAATVFGTVQREVPVVGRMLRQQRVTQPCAALERHAQDQVHALGTAKLVQRLQQGLHGRIAVQGSAVGGGDQHRSDLRVVAHFLLEHLQVQALGVQRPLDRHLHIGQQRPTIGGSAALLQVTRQAGTRLQVRHRAGDFLAHGQQQLFKTLAQVFQVQWLAQISRGVQRQRLAHTGAVAAIAHQNERQPRALGAHLAQQVEAIDAGQLTRSDDQVGLAR
ncbi:hypothetical protein D3C76_923300 [compost metagenome]